jgi:D-galacturonate reductase
MSLGPPSLTRAGSSRDSDSTHTPLFRQVTKGGFDGTQSPINVLMVGSGEYTTGFVNGSASKSDKAAGVVALTMFDLRNRGKVDRLAICGVNGMKFPAIREHMNKAIADVYDGLDVTVDTFPADDAVDPSAYVAALDSFHPGDAVTIFTPDDTHFEIAMAAVERGLHVLLTKPAVMTLEHHRLLHQASVKRGVIVSVEVHKRWDPMYADARDRIKQLGQFSYFYAYMSQPKSQLQTFKGWAGKSSDISYYLNSHHIDFHEWAVGETSRPVKVTATASYGIAKALHNMDCEDTITLTVLWENFEITGEDGEERKTTRVTGAGTAVYTSSWVAPKSDVHSQQRFFYMGQVRLFQIQCF